MKGEAADQGVKLCELSILELAIHCFCGKKQDEDLFPSRAIVRVDPLGLSSIGDCLQSDQGVVLDGINSKLQAVHRPENQIVIENGVDGCIAFGYLVEPSEGEPIEGIEDYFGTAANHSIGLVFIEDELQWVVGSCDCLEVDEGRPIESEGQNPLIKVDDEVIIPIRTHEGVEHIQVGGSGELGAGLELASGVLVSEEAGVRLPADYLQGLLVTPTHRIRVAYPGEPNDLIELTH